MALADRYSTLEFDLDSFPLVLVHFPQRFEAETLQQLKAMQERLYGFKQRYLSIVDLRDTGLVPNASIRREASDWTKAQEPLLKRYQLANALVFRSPIVRAGLQAVHWFAPPPVPTIVTGTLAEAARFLLASAKQQGFVLEGHALRELELRASEQRR